MQACSLLFADCLGQLIAIGIAGLQFVVLLAVGTAGLVRLEL